MWGSLCINVPRTQSSPLTYGTERTRETGRVRQMEREGTRARQMEREDEGQNTLRLIYTTQNPHSLSLVLCSSYVVFLYFQIFHSCSLYLDLQPGSSQIAVYSYMTDLSAISVTHHTVFFSRISPNWKQSVFTTNFYSHITSS